MRHRALLVGLMAVVVASCAANRSGAPPPGAPDPVAVGFEGARIDDGGRALVVSFIGGAAGSGPCTWTYRGDVTETTSDVTVRIRGTADGPPTTCARITVTVGPAQPSPIPPNSTATGEATVQGRSGRWVLPNSVGYEELVLADDRYAVTLAPYGIDRSLVEQIAEGLRPLPVAEGATAPALPG